MSGLKPEMVRSGYVMILGLPNVGKSTLMNRLLDQKLAAVSPKPQTTRNRILGIANGPDHQVLFLDTPGVCRPDSELNKFLLAQVDKALADADLICFMTEPERRALHVEREILKRLKDFKGQVFLLINKVDQIAKTKLLPLIENYSNLARFDEVFPISATKGDNCDALFEAIKKNLPLGPRLYPEDELSDITERFLAAEIVREKVFLLTRQEIPYSTAVMVNSFEESEPIIRIQADVIVERDSQKGIVIGKGGLMLKSIGVAARTELEEVFAKKIHLELFVKVVTDWSKNAYRLRELGYSE